jgi:hypothetical protein|tara:strand:- start:326 stop:2071 length:1746 start_codon:yes stop_codon:yes gene_type:complete
LKQEIIVIGALLLGFLASHLVPQSEQPERKPPMGDNPAITDEIGILGDTTSPKEETTPSADQLLTMPAGFRRYYLTHKLANETKLADMPSLVLSALQITVPFHRLGTTAIFMERFVELDPRAAVEFFEDNVTTDDDHYTRLFQGVYRQWARQDTEAAIVHLNTMSDASLQHNVRLYLSRDAVIQATGLLDDFLTGLSPMDANRESHYRLWNLSPRDAYFQVLAVENQDKRRYLMASAVDRWARQDPPAVIEQLSKRDVPEDHLMTRAFQIWTATDPESAIQYADSFATLSAVITFVASTDPYLAIDLLDQSGADDKNRQMLRQSIVGSWMHKDLAAATAYVESQGPDFATRMASSLADKLAETDPLQAIQWLEHLEQPRAVGRISSILAGSDMDAAESYFSSLPSGQVRSAVLTAIVSEKIRQDPRVALAWLAGLGDDEYAVGERIVFSDWASKDPAAVADTLDSISSPLLKEETVFRMMGRWYGQDHEEATRWVDALPPGRIRDVGSQALVSTMAVEGKFDGILSRVEAISNEDIKRRAQFSVVSQLIRRRPERFDQLATDYGLTVEQRQMIASRLGRSR